jgi:hypothetical protein
LAAHLRVCAWSVVAASLRRSLRALYSKTVTKPTKYRAPTMDMLMIGLGLLLVTVVVLLLVLLLDLCVGGGGTRPSGG